MDHLRSGIRDPPGQPGETPSPLKNAKLSQAWWQAPEMPAIWEAEAGEMLEPKRQRSQRTKITPLHFSLAKKQKSCRRWSYSQPSGQLLPLAFA